VVRTGALQLRTSPGIPDLMIQHSRGDLQKRFYILFVARGDDGQLRKISIPVHYLYVFVVGAAIGFLSLTGIASSYTRMLLKVSHYNELRQEKDQLRNNYSRLEQVAKERDVQVASLGSIAGEVSALYGLKTQPVLVTASAEQIGDAEVSSSLDQLHVLRTSALSGATMVGFRMASCTPFTPSICCSPKRAPSTSWIAATSILHAFTRCIRLAPSSSPEPSRTWMPTGFTPR